MSEGRKALGMGAALTALLLTAGIFLTAGVASAVGRSTDKTIASALAAKVDVLSAEVEALKERLALLENAVQEAKAQAADRVDALQAKMGVRADELRERIEATRSKDTVVLAERFGDKDCMRFGGFFDHHDGDFDGDFRHDDDHDGGDFGHHGWDRD